MGNCFLLNTIGLVSSEGVKEIRGIKTVCPMFGPADMVASTTLLWHRVTLQRVPFCSIGLSIERSSIIGVPGFNLRTCGGKQL